MDAIERTAALPCFDNPQEIAPLGGGITNINLSVRDGDRRFVVRLGADIDEHGVMRWNELALSRAAEAAGISPAVVHAEPGVLVLDFVDGKTYAEEDVRDPSNLPRILSLVSRAHRELGQHLRGPVLTFWPFQVVRTYARRLAEDGTSHAGELPGLMKEADALEAATGPVELVIGHNDLLAANLIDDGTRIWLIDWEYGGFNSPLFDLAGLAGNNGLSEAQERAMLETYFDAPAEARWRPYQAMKCISLMRETLWSMTSEIHSELDFDYAAYTAENLARLRATLSDFRNA
ncbi:choline/ethanolamine kinase family protein [Ovoidimarina sediminis]|uniref:choline/ethanolamine kinase family protein n=1 Tax=Ovoidimarina sediminis TaxID=3079856 RepID=UPI002908FCC4|nr:choline/ethanolamine kinase family protein [Rhodophyticola sp. MJ-SS7]MDU8944245.1 choline/ethanolamine kinase family protein [Rhodophyticola sp. MJ-SS7]